MPVIGHAFAGLTLARLVRPSPRPDHVSPAWVPSLVILAYLPDIAALALELVHERVWDDLTHSVPLAVPAALLLAWPLRWLTGCSPGRAFLIVLVSLVLHATLDLLQTPYRLIFWPLTDWHPQAREGLLPRGIRHELLIFGAVYLAAEGLRAGVMRSRRRPLLQPPSTGPDTPGGALAGHARGWGWNPPVRRRRRHQWIAWSVTAAMILVAAGTHRLRDVRRGYFEQAERLIRAGAPAEALTLLDQADAWPRFTRPGRIDFSRGIAYLRLGDSEHAEAHLRRAYDADPGHFWYCLGLARLYADSDRALEERRKLAAPYIRELRTRHRDMEAAPRSLTRLARQLDLDPFTFEPLPDPSATGDDP